MKKLPPPVRENDANAGKAPPAGKRSGKGSSSVLPYLSEALSSRPAPLEPEPPAPGKRPRGRW